MPGPVHQIKPAASSALCFRENKPFSIVLPKLPYYLLLEGIAHHVELFSPYVLAVHLISFITHNSAVYLRPKGVSSQYLKLAVAVSSDEALFNVTCPGYFKVIDNLDIQNTSLSHFPDFIYLAVSSDHLLVGYT